MITLRWLPLLALLLALPTPQGRADQTNQSSARWEKAIAAFERSDATNPPPKGAVLFIGSSGIRLWHTLAADFPKHRVINRGFGGSEIADSTHFADRIIFPYAPRAIFLRAGGNDLANGKSPEQVFADFKAFVATVQAKLPETDITFIGWNHTIARWSQQEKETTLNTLVREFVSQNPRVRYIETAPAILGPDGRPRADLLAADKLHFSAEGYRILADLVRPHLPPATR
jgi:lysophospholipase L1-like esterase